jgi:hypothetical protein
MLELDNLIRPSCNANLDAELTSRVRVLVRNLMVVEVVLVALDDALVEEPPGRDVLSHVY